MTTTKAAGWPAACPMWVVQCFLTGSVIRTLFHFDFGFAIPDPELPEAFDKSGNIFGRRQGNDAFIEVGLRDAGFLEQRHGGAHVSYELAMGESIGHEITRGRLPDEIGNCGLRRQ